MIKWNYLGWGILAIAVGMVFGYLGVGYEMAKWADQRAEYNGVVLKNTEQSEEDNKPHEYTCNTDTECMEECLNHCPPDEDCDCTGDPVPVEPEEMVQPQER